MVAKIHRTAYEVRERISDSRLAGALLDYR